MAQSHREASRRLFDLAEQQQGFFTTSRPRLPDLPKIRIPITSGPGTGSVAHRGINRMALFPAPDRPDLVLWSLWSRNRKEEIDGVYNHQTA